MKRLNSILYMAFTAMMVTSLAGCTDDTTVNSQQPTLGNTPIAIRPAKKPEFKVYSGGQTISAANTRAVDVNGNLWYQNWERPVNITDAERDKVVEEFSKVREDAVNTVSVTWKNFWVQQVYKGTATGIDGYGNNTGTLSDKMNHLQVFNNLKTEVISWWPYEEAVSVYEGEYEHINNFNSGDNTTAYTDDETHEQFVGTTLMKNMGTDGRAEQFGYHNSIDSKYHYEYITLKIDGSYYIGFDFFANGTQEYPANKNMDVERDWIFNDWIIKVSPAQVKGGDPIDPNLDGDDPTDDPTDDPADNPAVDPTDDPTDDPTGDPTDDPTDDPADDPVSNPVEDAVINGEVEVNLSVNTEKDYGDYIATKLSIHVREITDVEVFIPVPAEYYCVADDMNIVASHRLEMERYATSQESVTYNINGYDVTLSVLFELNGVRVKSEGMNSEVLQYLRDTYADGLTFEVWNYYKASVDGTTFTRDQLKPMLDQSTVSFTNDPMRYVNAFAKLNGAKNAWDCIVTPPTVYAVVVEDDGENDYNVVYTKD